MPKQPAIPNIKDPLVRQQLLEALAYKEQFCFIEGLFPKYGEFRRTLYLKHMIHYTAGRTHRQRLLMCANQIGKTTAAGCELVYHTTGEYPEWWKGKRFGAPQEWWVCGKTHKTVFDIMQSRLLGPVGMPGTGLYPKHTLDVDTMTTAKKVDTQITDFRIRHASGGFSTISFKSYDQGRGAFEGAVRSIWLDEEPPLDIYAECLMRTISGDNILMMTFTPLEGMSDTIQNFLGGNIDYTDGEKGDGKWLTTATWDDVPHLDDKRKKELLASFPEYQRDARSKGIPMLGSGAIYPVPPSMLFIDPIAIPEHWKRVFSIDFGFQDPTAILWGAIDPESEVLYIYMESYLKQEVYSIHADIIKRHSHHLGYAIPGVCDPSGGGRSTADGKLTRKEYKDLGVIFFSADNSLEVGLNATLTMMLNGKLKIFTSCVNTYKEYRTYQRNVKGKPIDSNNHAMDALRYMVMSGLTRAKSLAQVKAHKLIENKDYQESLTALERRDDSWLYL
ncbi:MAG: terminase large subunit domain-containing protein [Candidatus Dormibacteria bacterium]